MDMDVSVYQLSKMIEKVRQCGVVYGDSNHFYDCVSKTMPFVYLREPKEVVDSISEINEENLERVSDLDKKFDAPFSNFSVETFNPISNKSGALLVNFDGDKISCIHCSLYYEISPKSFGVYSLISDENNKSFYVTHHRQSLVLSKHLEMINSSLTGYEKVSEKIRLGNGQNKYFHKINRVIYCRNKDIPTNIDYIKNGKIDWTHKFMVRGHWRKTDSIGKDRAGEYIVPGFTWVTEHEKGDGILINKIRIIDQTAQILES